jgi:hypothetical protein
LVSAGAFNLYVRLVSFMQLALMTCVCLSVRSELRNERVGDEDNTPAAKGWASDRSSTRHLKAIVRFHRGGISWHAHRRPRSAALYCFSLPPDPQIASSLQRMRPLASHRAPGIPQWKYILIKAQQASPSAWLSERPAAFGSMASQLQAAGNLARGSRLPCWAL